MHQLQIVLKTAGSKELHSFFENLFNPPSLFLAERPTFLYENHITYVAYVLRIIGEVLDRGLNVLAVQFMPELALYTDDDTFFHSIADNRTGPCLSGFGIFSHNLSIIKCVLRKRPCVNEAAPTSNSLLFRD